MNKKVVSIVLNNFTHDNRVLKENISLKNNDYSPIVIALHEGNLPEKEEVCGILVHRIKLISKNWSKNIIVQIFKYIEFIIRVIYLYKKADIFHCNDLNALPVGILIKLFFNRNAKVIYDAHEYEIEIDGMTKITRLVSHLIEGILIRLADGVITVSNSIANEYSKLYKIKKPYLVLNCPSYSLLSKKDLFRKELGIRKNQTIFLYQGSLSQARGLEKILYYFESQKNDKSVIVFMGYGPMENMIKNSRSNNVYFHEAVNSDVLLNYTSSADYGLFICDNICKSFYYCLPNKIFEYLHAGIPIIASDFFELGKFIRTNNIGSVSKSSSYEDITKALSDISKLNYKEISYNARELAKKYCWESQEKILLKAYSELFASNR